jgi:hypothetical protein
MTAVLVSGAPDLVARVAAALRAHDADVTEVTDLADVPAVCAAAGPRAFDGYVQLPATFQPHGDTAVLRVHHFYAKGVLARFTALAAVLPALSLAARLTFVMGTLPPEAATDDDREARRALTRVLVQAARADMPDGHLVVRVLDAGTTAEETSRAVLGLDPGSLDPGRKELIDRLDELSYADWRVELLGLASVET